MKSSNNETAGKRQPTTTFSDKLGAFLAVLVSLILLSISCNIDADEYTDNLTQFYSAKIKNKIESAWLKPVLPDGKTYQTAVKININETGGVTEVRIEQSSGILAFDRSVELAIYKSDPLPIPDNPIYYDIFEEIHFVFSHQNHNNKFFTDEEIHEYEKSKNVYKTPPRKKTKPPVLPSLLVKEIQQLLTDLEIDAGPIDGLMGKKTVTAIKIAQNYFGFEQTGKPSERLRDSLANAKKIIFERLAKKEAKPIKVTSTGSGFFVDTQHILTNSHVIEDCYQVKIKMRRKKYDVIDHWYNKLFDVALLKIDEKIGTRLIFAASDTINLGDEIYALGYPLSGILSDNINYTSGSIRSLSGMLNDQSQIQISAEINSGNSGGPVLNNQGLVVGMVVSRLNDSQMLKEQGEIPQQVNFAIRSEILKDLLRQTDIEYVTSRTQKVDTATNSLNTPQIICLNPS